MIGLLFLQHDGVVLPHLGDDAVQVCAFYEAIGRAAAFGCVQDAPINGVADVPGVNKAHLQLAVLLQTFGGVLTADIRPARVQILQLLDEVGVTAHKHDTGPGQLGELLRVGDINVLEFEVKVVGDGIFSWCRRDIEGRHRTEVRKVFGQGAVLFAECVALLFELALFALEGIYRFGQTGVFCIG